MFYCQKKHNIPIYINDYQMLFMCPFGNQVVPIEGDNIYSNTKVHNDVLSKAETAIIEGCEKNCILCEETRNNKEFIDTMLQCVSYINAVMETTQMTKDSAGKFIGKAYDSLRLVKDHMKIWNDDLERK